MQPTPINRESLHRVQAKLTKFLHLEEELWKQKAGTQWFQYRDRNTKFFHAYVKGRRKRLQVKRTQDQQGNWLEEKEEIVEDALRFYRDQFTKEEDPSDFEILDHLPRIIDEAIQIETVGILTEEEVKKVLFGLNGESAGGPEFYTFVLSVLLRNNQGRYCADGDCLLLWGRVLTRNLNALHHISQFKGFGMPKWSPKINHLAKADDMIIFSLVDVLSMELIMAILRKYEKMSGQKINMAKSSLHMHQNVPADISITVEIATGIERKDFPFMYLGFLIFHSRRRKGFFNVIMLKIMNRLQGWKGKLLSFGGRAILIKHVLQSMPIHLLSAVNPPDCVINKMHRIFAQFFWSNTIGGRSRHWVAWNKMCLPIKEGGLGCRSLHDVSMALYCKVWWNFRTKPSLWHAFISNKYCKRENSVVVQWRYGTQTWKKMLEAKDLIEHQIW
ncbi:uncharacterized protein LOC132048838 [Lycium ferocissimum]|uniref:uncharacterized protein LOC132048838 n=1 Tax=Lycium ferocissimum TaxID=112874 RepID=UPI00281534EF|nr:uncharacterized protein LOC132048838 [Lycium ferocissimum]